LLEDTVPGSRFDMCANSDCKVGVPDTGSNWAYPVLPLNSGFFNMHYWTGDSTGTSTLKLYVYEASAPNDGDTLTYVMNISCFGVGITENDNMELIDVFPSPADNYFSINFQKNNSDEVYTANLIDALGRIVLSKEISGLSDNKLFVGEIKRGIYILEVRNKHKYSIHIKKMIIERN